MYDNLRALTFDLDDTLWDNRPVLRAAEQSLYDWLAEHYPRIKRHYSLEDMQQLRRDLLQRNPPLRDDVNILRKTSLRLAAETAGYDHSLVEPAFAVFLEARHRITLYSDVVPALRRLRDAGFCLGTLSNGNADVQRLGLGHLFDFSLSAASTGRAKPHPRMFQEACRRANVAPAQLAHVGDEAETDLAGAQAAGVTVIWMNRGGQRADPGVAHHAEVRDMTELLTLLGLN
ncbi:MAG: HAD-IA family hydrolase [Gammaproteobacteria bacterium]|nr:MAG: HAD-IA family hydrolase [Gammaproteobacteria bacterium]